MEATLGERTQSPPTQELKQLTRDGRGVGDRDVNTFKDLRH